jgi:hypothetical protein
VINYQQSGQSPQTVRGKMMTNTRSGYRKVRQVQGSASDSGPRQVLEKKNLRSQKTQSDLQKALRESKKMRPVAPDIQQ